MKKVYSAAIAVAIGIVVAAVGATSAQANGYTDASPTSGGPGQVVAITAGHDISFADQAVCVLDQTSVAIPVTPTPNDTFSASMTIVALPAEGTWACSLYSGSNEIFSARNFTFTYAGATSVAGYDPCPVELPHTGIANGSTPVGLLALALIAAGVVGVVVARGRRGKTAALVIPLLLAGTLAALPAQRASADSSAVVASLPVLTMTLDDPSSPTNATVSQIGSAQWIDNSDGCGSLSYQMQVQHGLNAAWENSGDVTQSPSTATFELATTCLLEQTFAREIVTLTTRTGSVTATSVPTNVCPPI